MPYEHVDAVCTLEDVWLRGCGEYILVDFWFVGHVIDEVESDFAATADCSLVVPPAPLHAVTAPVVVVEGTHTTLGEEE